MRARSGGSRASAALLMAAIVVLAVPGPVAAHAELVRAIPAAGETVTEPVTVVSGRYSEDLAGGSRLELLDGTGATVAGGGIDLGDPRVMVVRPDTPLVVGDYTVESTAISADGHIERTRWTFTVFTGPTKALPTPTIGPASSTPASGRSATPSTTVSTSPTTSPSPGAAPGGPTSGSGDALLPIIVALAIVAIGAGFLLSRNRGRSA